MKSVDGATAGFEKAEITDDWTVLCLCLTSTASDHAVISSSSPLAGAWWTRCVAWQQYKRGLDLKEKKKVVIWSACWETEGETDSVCLGQMKGNGGRRDC